jgi:hypothetical protein
MSWRHFGIRSYSTLATIPISPFLRWRSKARHISRPAWSPSALEISSKVSRTHPTFVFVVVVPSSNCVCSFGSRNSLNYYFLRDKSWSNSKRSSKYRYASNLKPGIWVRVSSKQLFRNLECLRGPSSSQFWNKLAAQISQKSNKNTVWLYWYHNMVALGYVQGFSVSMPV